MRIGFDITSISDQPSGVGYYTLHLLTHLAEADGGHEYLLLSNRPARPASLLPMAPLREVLRPFPSRMLWMQCRLPATLREMQPEVCHYPNSIGPVASPCPYVVSIHDMTLSLLPGYHPWRRRLAVRPLIPLVAWRARRIITMSEQSRQDIIRLLRVAPERVVVIPEAAAPLFRPAAMAEQRRVRAIYRITAPYVLYVGTLEPRKNLVRLIHAWHRLRQRGRIAHQLVIVGARGWQDQPIYQTVRVLRCAGDVIFTGYVPMQDLPPLYSGADAFAFPSLYEGFGLPVLEAMACGTPVLISTTPALVEVAGDAALKVDGHAVEAIGAGLECILTDPGLQAEMRERGLQRARDFSWKRAAEQTLKVYQHVAAGAA